ncbi:hypothetical protein ACFLQL_00260 [Verrucomicrobiota bacterium]
MADLTLDQVTQEDVDTAKELIMNMIKSDPKYANLDLSVGTVLHDLLLLPTAELWALENKRYDFIQSTKSFKDMAESGEVIDPSYVNALLSNFNMEMLIGTKAYGPVIVKVSKDREYTVEAGFAFVNNQGLRFLTDADYTASMNPTAEQIQLYQSVDETYYYFIVNVVAENFGTNYLLSQGVNLDIETPLFDFISAEVYAAFTGAVPSESISDVIAKIPIAISYRGLNSNRSIAAMLMDADYGNFSAITALSVVGAGNDAQLRDKHNYLGGSMFGRVDVYPRTFATPVIETLLINGTRTGVNTYELEIDADLVPGFYAIKSVTDAESVVNPIMSFDTLVPIGSYPFVETRSCIPVSTIPHDISEDNKVIETAYTRYQNTTIVVNNVTTAPLEEHPFKVEIYVAPQIAEIQDYVDSFYVKNQNADYLIRSPLLCLAAIGLTIDKSTASTVTVDDIKNKLLTYINAKSFVTKLAQSELIGALYELDIKYIDLSNDPIYGFKLQGQIRGADGSIVTLYGSNTPNLVLTDVQDKNILVTPSTCVFAIEPERIFINLRTVT